MNGHNVILNKYGQDLYVDYMIQDSSYPDDKPFESVLRLIGNLTRTFDKDWIKHEIVLNVDGVNELMKLCREFLDELQSKVEVKP